MAQFHSALASTSIGFAFPAIGGLTALPGVWRIRYQARRDLARILASDLYLLGDIGLTEAAAAEEAAKPFWKA